MMGPCFLGEPYFLSLDQTNNKCKFYYRKFVTLILEEKRFTTAATAFSKSLVNWLAKFHTPLSFVELIA